MKKKLLKIITNFNNCQYISKCIESISNQKKYLFFTSIFPLIFWFIMSPHLRYGGYAFLLMFLFSICFALNLINNLSFKKIKVFIFIALSFLIIKNIDRIHKEISNNQFTMIPKFEKISYSSTNFVVPPFIDSYKINISENSNFCGNIEMLCVIKSNLLSIKNIRKNNGYFLITSNETAAINSMNLEIERIKKNINKN